MLLLSTLTGGCSKKQPDPTPAEATSKVSTPAIPTGTPVIPDSPVSPGSVAGNTAIQPSSLIQFPQASTQYNFIIAEIRRLADEFSKKHGNRDMTGKGYTVGMAQNGLINRGKTEMEPHRHSMSMRALLFDPEKGAIPGATYQNLSIQDLNDPQQYILGLDRSGKLVSLPDKMPDNATCLKTFVHGEALNMLQSINRRYTTLLSKDDPSIRVITASYGRSYVELVDRIYDQLETLATHFPTMRQELYGAELARSVNTPANQEKKKRAIIAYLRDPERGNIRYEAGPLKESLDTLRATFAKLKARGILVVASAGNAPSETIMAGQGMGFAHIDYQNFEALAGPHILVGASDGHGTPADRSDDTVFRESTPGIEGVVKPNLLFDGNRVMFKTHDGKNAYISGTSSSAELVGALIVLSLEATDGKMSPDEIIQLLVNSAVPLSHEGKPLPNIYQGAGVLDPAKVFEQLETRVSNK